MTIEHVERPSAGDPVGALVFFHGYYDVPETFVPFLDELDPERRFHGYLPRGPLPLEGGKRSWFEFESPRSPHEQLDAVAAWLDTVPFPAERTVLGGWSQGTAVAFVLGLASGRPRRAGLLALGGWLPEGRSELERPPPVAIAHGAADAVVGIDSARRTRDLLEAAGGEVVYRETGVAHALDPAWTPDLRRFLGSLP